MSKKKLTYRIQPKVATVPKGTLFKTKTTLYGTAAAGIHEDDEEFEYGGDEKEIPEGTILMFVEDEQFMGSKNCPMSAWVRFHLVVDQSVYWVTVSRVQKREWDFKTLRGKKNIIQSAMEENFELIQLGEE